MHDGVCLVTGGAGFIGCALSTRLAERFGRVVAMDNLHPQVHATRMRPVALDARVELVEGDVTQIADWDRVLADVRPDIIVHLAAETGTGQSLTEASRHAETNVTGTTRMLDALSAHAIVPRKIVLTSSRAVYGEGAWTRASDGAVVYPGQRDRAMLERGEWDFPGLHAQPFASESTWPHPTSVYGATKLAQEHVLSSWALAFGVQPVILRLQNVYGAGQSLSNPYTGIVSLFCRLAREGKTIPIYEDGEIIRDFIYITDVADAILAAMDSEAAASHICDVGSGEATSIMRLGQLIAARYAAPAPIVSGAFRHGDVRHASCGIDVARRTLAWSPKVALPEGLERLGSWMEQSLPA